MKKYNLVVVLIAIALFIVPFFWLKPGFVDLGGDGGRLYFINPLVSINNWVSSLNVFSYAFIPYVFFFYVLSFVAHTPTQLIGVEHGLQLSLSFLGMYLVVKEILIQAEKKANRPLVSAVGIVTGIVYLGFIAKVGWPTALETLNQIFLNVIVFYLLLKYCLTDTFGYMLAVLFVSSIFFANFGLGDAPQLLSFYPLSLLFLYLYMRFAVGRRIPWKGLLFGLALFIGLHALDIFPVMRSFLTKADSVTAQVFNKDTILSAGVHYFAANHADSGKMSKELFQWWLGQNILGLMVPVIAILGFLKTRSKLLSLIGVFFLLTLFLVAANITHLGVTLYEKLFYIPGFTMFRSFNEKWYFVFAFFYALMFAISLYFILKAKNRCVIIVVCAAILTVSVYRILPLLSGKAIQGFQFESANVPMTYSLDPDLLDALSYTRKLPDDGNVLTLPLTFPYYQIAYGKEGGAYVGISMVANVAGKQDFPGFWTFGDYNSPIFEALRKENTKEILQILSLFNVQYVFRNTDPRIMDNFPQFPYIYPRDQIPLMKNQETYSTWLSSLPITKLYQQGFYQIYQFDDSVVRSTVYIPDIIYGTREELFNGPSFRSAYIETKFCTKILCKTHSDSGPSVTYVKKSPALYSVTIDLKGQKTPFLLVLANSYNSAWDVSLEGIHTKDAIVHSMVNGYANGWLIDPKNVTRDVLHGRIYLMSENYVYAGAIISGSTLGIVLLLAVYEIVRRRNGKK